MAMSPGGRTMRDSPGAVGAVIGATGGVGGVAVSPLTAMRTELGMVAALLAAAGLAWWSTAERMAGMDAGTGDRPRFRGLVHGRVGDDDGGDDVAVARAGGSRLCGVGPTRAQPGLLFAAAICSSGVSRASGPTACSSSGRACSPARWPGTAAAGGLRRGILALAALYQLTPLKRAFLSRCRSPLRSLDASWPDTRPGALVIGSAQRRMVPRMFVGPDGRAVRARCDEPHVDGVDRRDWWRSRRSDPGGAARGWRPRASWSCSRLRFSPCRTTFRGSSFRARPPHSTR